MRIVMPEKVQEILKQLKKHGFKGYIVGGCVRDAFLGRTPEDWDITTDATPEEILTIFKDFKVIPTGLEHGTVTILIDKEAFEVTTFRIDGEYVDNRRPKDVEFTKNIEKDLHRRDFTINAMAYNDEEGFIDPFEGKEDIENKRIVAVGQATHRFEEDALRIMRGVRFATQLNFDIEESTYNAMYERRSLLKNISKERIQIELNKILLTPKPSRGIKILTDLKLMEYIIPEVNDMVGFEQKNPHHDKDVFNHTMAVLDETKVDLSLRLAALFHDIGKPHTFSIDENGVGHFYGHEDVGSEMAGKILRRLRYDNRTIKKVKTLIKEHMIVLLKPTQKATKRFINRVGQENLDLFFDLQKSDIKGTKEPYCFEYVEKLQKEVRKILVEKQPLKIKDMKIDGKDIINLGVPQGKQIGIILKELSEKVLDDPTINTRDKLIEEVKQMMV